MAWRYFSARARSFSVTTSRRVVSLLWARSANFTALAMGFSLMRLGFVQRRGELNDALQAVVDTAAGEGRIHQVAQVA